MSDSVAFGLRLKELREAAGLTQAQLAERAGLHRQGIVKLERGEREPAWGTVLALVEALGVSCDEFRQPPTRSHDTRPGRPRKAPTEGAAAPRKSARRQNRQ
jgi:transcriptional regulator with XRE-family HTH domain